MEVRFGRPGSAPGRRTWCGAIAAAAAGVLLAAFAVAPGPARARGSPGTAPTAAGYHFPTVPAGHTHVRQLLANAMRYADPEHGITDPASGYPYEGWNHDSDQKVFLRSFTQLTAIGLWMELLANIAAGLADTPHLSRDRALAELARVAGSLRRDQQDPELGANGLLGNFLNLDPDRRRGSLTADADRRTVRVVFGDNANLSASAAKTIGALLLPGTKDRPGAAAVRRELERFLDDQRAGYADLYDPEAGLFYFGWDGQRGGGSGRRRSGASGRRTTWTTWSTSSAARPHSSSSGTASRRPRSRTWACR